MTNAHLDVIKAPCAALFGDDKGAVYALDAQSGALLWKTQVESHPTRPHRRIDALISGTCTWRSDSSEPESARDPGYGCCTFRGSVAALDVASGQVEWKSHLVGEGAAGGGHRGPAAPPRFAPAGVPGEWRRPRWMRRGASCTWRRGTASDPTAAAAAGRCGRRARSRGWQGAAGARQLPCAAGRPRASSRGRPCCARSRDRARDAAREPALRHGLRPRPGALWARCSGNSQAAAPDAPGGIAPRRGCGSPQSLRAALGTRRGAARRCGEPHRGRHQDGNQRRWHMASPTHGVQLGRSRRPAAHGQAAARSR
jgi:hypothetical protein